MLSQEGPFYLQICLILLTFLVSFLSGFCAFEEALMDYFILIIDTSPYTAPHDPYLMYRDIYKTGKHTIYMFFLIHLKF